MESLKSWFSTASSTGWIPREQFRGIEMLEYLPPHLRYTLKANKEELNPPTFALNINYFINLI